MSGAEDSEAPPLLPLSRAASTGEDGPFSRCGTTPLDDPESLWPEEARFTRARAPKRVLKDKSWRRARTTEASGIATPGEEWETHASDDGPLCPAGSLEAHSSASRTASGLWPARTAVFEEVHAPAPAAPYAASASKENAESRQVLSAALARVE